MQGWFDIRLTAGHHSSPADGLCLMEAVALFVGERHADWPDCVCPVLIEFGRVLNDAMPDRWRTDLLLPLVPVLVGTRDPGSPSCGIMSTALERARARMLVDWCANVPAGTAGDGEADQRAREASVDAADALRFGQAQHAARNAAAAVAWAVKAASDRAMAGALRAGQSPAAAARAASQAGLGIWRGAIDAYRRAAALGRPAPTGEPLPARERADGWGRRHPDLEQRRPSPQWLGRDPRVARRLPRRG